MQWRWLVVVAATLGLLAAGPALAKHKRYYHHRHKTHWVNRACVDRPLEFSWTGWLFNPQPQPNGCAPPVYEYDEYIGQDPDPFIRLQLRRDPATGYATDLAR